MFDIKPNGCAFNILYTFDGRHNIGDDSIYSIRKQLSHALARKIASSGRTYDFVVPIPNTGIYYANHVALKLGVPYKAFFTKAKNRRTLGLSINERKSFYERFLYSDVLVPSTSNILFIDEALISGTTLQALSEWASRFRVKNVSFGFASPPVVNHCPVDFIKGGGREFCGGCYSYSDFEAYRNKLIKSLGFDEIHFLDYDSFHQIMKGDERCTLCFSRFAR